MLALAKGRWGQRGTALVCSCAIHFVQPRSVGYKQQSISVSKDTGQGTRSRTQNTSNMLINEHYVQMRGAAARGDPFFKHLFLTSKPTVHLNK
jgi:hypothetical protein